MSLEQFQAAGHYDPTAPRSAERAELIAHLVERFGVEAVLEAADRVPMFTVAVELGDPVGEQLTARQVAEASGLDLDGVVQVRAASGFPVHDPDEASLPPSAVEDAEVVQLAASMFGREPTLAFTRVMGASVARIADAARALFATSVVDGSEGVPVSELDLSLSNELAWVAWKTVPGVVSRMMLERANTWQDLIRRIVDGDLEVAIVFVDLVGSTAWTMETEPSRHAAALSRFEQAAWDTAAAHGGRLVKLIGDEAMIVADDGDAACRIATRLCELAEADDDLPAACGGAGYGAVVARAGDYFGPVVNLVARAVDQAGPGQVVVTAPVADQLDATHWKVEALGPTPLRGVADPVDLFSVRPDPGS